MSDATQPTAGGGRTWLYLALAFAAFWALYLAFLAPGKPGGGTADFAWSPRDLDGHPVPLASFKGKPIFLNVWATWCPPCVRELPSIARLAANPRLEGVAILCVSVDDSPETVKAFVKDKNWPASMTVLHSSQLPPVFTTEGIPATFVIDRDGKIVTSEVGAAEWDTPDVVRQLRQLKGESAD